MELCQLSENDAGGHHIVGEGATVQARGWLSGSRSRESHELPPLTQHTQFWQLLLIRTENKKDETWRCSETPQSDGTETKYR